MKQKKCNQEQIISDLINELIIENICLNPQRIYIYFKDLLLNGFSKRTLMVQKEFVYGDYKRLDRYTLNVMDEMLKKVFIENDEIRQTVEMNMYLTILSYLSIRNHSESDIKYFLNRLYLSVDAPIVFELLRELLYLKDNYSYLSNNDANLSPIQLDIIKKFSQLIKTSV